MILKKILNAEKAISTSKRHEAPVRLSKYTTHDHLMLLLTIPALKGSLIATDITIAVDTISIAKDNSFYIGLSTNGIRVLSLVLTYPKFAQNHLDTLKRLSYNIIALP